MDVEAAKIPGQTAERIAELRTECRKVFGAFAETLRIIQDGLDLRKGRILSSSISEKRLDQVLASMEAVHLRSEIAPRLRWAMLLAVYSYVEHLLNETCKAFYSREGEVEGKPSTTFPALSSMSGKGVRRAKKYLSKVVDVRVPHFFDLEMRIVNELRNVFAHNNGRANAYRKKKLADLRMLLEKRKQSNKDKMHWTDSIVEFELVECEYGEFLVQLGEQYVENFIEIIKVVFLQLFTEIDRKVGEGK